MCGIFSVHLPGKIKNLHDTVRLSHIANPDPHRIPNLIYPSGRLPLLALAPAAIIADVVTKSGDSTLLSFVAWRFTNNLEDVATDALFFILSHSASVRTALADLLEGERGPLPISSTRPWLPDAHGAIPDLACFDAADNLVALVESKFWAPLTHHQPVTYWQGLPADKPAVLLFLAPQYRLDEGSLWNELVDRLRDGGHELDPGHSDGGLVTASSKVDQRRLILTSWELLLEKMAERTRIDREEQACFEIAELQGLAASAIEGDRPTRDDNLKQLISDAVTRLVESGWANTDGMGVGAGHSFHARYLHLAGSSAALCIDHELLKEKPGRPVWLRFHRDPAAIVDVDAVHTSLVDAGEQDLTHRNRDILLPISLPEATDHQTTLEAVVADVERIARIIDPTGPTYRSDP